MPEINPLGHSNIPQQNQNINKVEQGAPDVSFDDMLKEADGGLAFVTDRTEVKDNALSQISYELIANDKTARDVVGYQKTFLGTFSKGTTAEINRTEQKITIKSPLGDMKLEAQGKELVYVEMPQGNFVGKLSLGEEGGIMIQSDDSKKSINIQPQINGEVKVTNKGIDEAVYLVFKPAK
ncbi:MAG: hypothetical protein ABIH00_11105 [Armatimonadota bacterium]